MTPLEIKHAVKRHPAFRSLTKVVERGHTLYTVRLFFTGNPAILDRTVSCISASRTEAFRKAALHLVTQRVTQ